MSAERRQVVGLRPRICIPSKHLIPRNTNARRSLEENFHHIKQRVICNHCLHGKTMPEINDYTIGWICALHTELVAAQEFLDEEYDPVSDKAPHDNNDYTVGRIGNHQVVIAVLPHQYGLVNAAAVLKDMVRSFSNLRVVLMVGIGGGVPTKHDIRLGDVVVSSAGNGHGGVIQYDFGRAIQDKAFEVTGHLNQPPIVVQTAINGLRAIHERRGNSIEDDINNILENNRKLRKNYRRPDALGDRLYKATFLHAGGDGMTCNEVCGDDNLVARAERPEEEDDLAIHYGLIASGNTLMKDALIRDRLSAESDVLCFEMEAAGLMNNFPCLVIRGICDYSDTHKNKVWQGYASMAAAAYAKTLLLRMATSSVLNERRVEDIISQSKEVFNHSE